MDIYTFNYELSHEFLKTLEQTEVEFKLHLLHPQKDILKADLSVEEIFTKEKILDDISRGMTGQGIGQFAFFNKVPSLIEKIYFEIFEYETEQDEERYSVVVPLAPILSLPSIEEDKAELSQLKDLFLFLKEEQLKNFGITFRLSVARGFGDTAMVITCDKKSLEKDINKAFNEKIEASPVLKAWRENIFKGIENTSTQCDNLFYNSHLSFLLNHEDLMESLRLSKERHKEEEKRLKEEKYQKQVQGFKEKKKNFF